jgi:hypothetical protein
MKMQIGHLEFPSKKTAKAHFSAILNTVPVGIPLNGDAHRDLLALYRNHYSLAHTVNEVAHFEVEIFKMPFISKQRRFVAVDNKGDRTPFSYLVALDGEPAPLTTFRAVARNVVIEDLHTWKRQKMARDGNFECAVSGARFPMDEVHVDHKPPLTFSVIVKGFLSARRIDLSAIAYREENGVKVGFSDSKLEAAFRDYHSKMAVLRIIHKHANVAAASKGRIKPSAKDGTLSPQ